MHDSDDLSEASSDGEAESPFRQPTPSEQRMGLGCVLLAISLLFVFILAGLLLAF